MATERCIKVVLEHRWWCAQCNHTAIHASQETKILLNEIKVDVLKWLACCPDLNQIENFLGQYFHAKLTKTEINILA